jgi:dihydroorotase-like cyclic amidohydrolase
MEDFATETRSAVIGGVTTMIVFHRAVDNYGNHRHFHIRFKAGNSPLTFWKADELSVFVARSYPPP